MEIHEAQAVEVRIYHKIYICPLQFKTHQGEDSEKAVREHEKHFDEQRRGDYEAEKRHAYQA